MEYRQLGRSGLQVSVIGLGTRHFVGRASFPHIDASGAEVVIDHALDMGINMIDTANTYGDGLSEAVHRQSAEG